MVDEEEPLFCGLEPRPFCLCKSSLKLLAGNLEKGFCIKEEAVWGEKGRNLLKQPLRFGNFVNDEDGKGCIDSTIELRGKAKGIWFGEMGLDAGHESLPFHLSPQNTEHLLLDVHRKHGARISNLPGKLAGEKTWTAAYIQDTAARFNVPLCQAIGTIHEPPYTVVEIPRSGRGEHVMAMRRLRLIGHERHCIFCTPISHMKSPYFSRYSYLITIGLVLEMEENLLFLMN